MKQAIINNGKSSHLKSHRCRGWARTTTLLYLLWALTIPSVWCESSASPPVLACPTPDNALSRVRASIISTYGEIVFWNPSLSDKEWRVLQKEMNSLKFIAKNPAFAKYPALEAQIWSIGGRPNEVYEVNKRTGSVLTVVTMPPSTKYLGPNKALFDDPGPSNPTSIAVNTTIDSLSVHERATDYIFRITVDPRLRSSGSAFILDVQLYEKTNSSRVDATPESKTVMRVEHLEAMDTITFVVSRDEMQKYAYIGSLIRTSNSGTTGTRTFADVQRF